ncbi:MAG TPA: segregation/condensation protein A [Mycobacteriales bacterium]|nr:segregation/condensation protein A [Mycobacteriales bacterium]
MTSGTSPAVAGRPAFEVHLGNFEGPFDLLLSLIAKHQMDVTEVALSQVTDEFIAYIRAAGPAWDLGQATEFLVVAATLLDLKAARLLPAGEVDDEEDVALLEARDLLFARLLQYRAYKEAAAIVAGLLAREERRHPREVCLEPRFAAAVPEVLLGLGPRQFAELAARALAPKPPPPGVAVDHVHVNKVSVRERAIVLAGRLAELGRASFRALVSDCTETVEVVASFLALLELYREGHVAFEQVVALGDLQVRWTAPADGNLSTYISVEEYEDVAVPDDPPAAGESSIDSAPNDPDLHPEGPAA